MQACRRDAVTSGRKHRSGCPVNLAVEGLGDRWSLVVLRDVMFGNKRRFGELHRSDEGIAFNILAARLRRLIELGLLTRTEDSDRENRATYSLTEMAIGLVPAIVHLGLWARRHLPATDALSARIELLADGGPELWARF